MIEQPATLQHPAHAGALDGTRRAAFVSRTYHHLLVAVLLFTGIEILLFRSGLAYPMAEAMLGVSWLLVLGGFVVAGFVFRGMAERATSPGTQYLALGGYVLAQAIIFVPLLVIAEYTASGVIASAALTTLIGFTGLTGIAVTSGKDFSFLGGLMKWGGVVALALIVGGVAFGFNLGTYFSVAMIGLAGAAILYETSRVLNHYPEDKHVAAAVALFASVALMFWYVLSIFISRD
jgi:uncharacterized protein